MSVHDLAIAKYMRAQICTELAAPQLMHIPALEILEKDEKLIQPKIARVNAFQNILRVSTGNIASYNCTVHSTAITPIKQNTTWQVLLISGQVELFGFSIASFGNV